MSMLPEYPSDPIAYLLRRRFGDAALTGPVSGIPEDEQETEARLVQETQTYRTELEGLEEEQLFALAYQERERETREFRELDEQTAFYSRQDAQADFQYWAKYPLWTLDEAVALTLGKDPRVVTWAKIEECAEPSQFKADFSDLRLLVHRAKEAQQLDDLVSPADYIAWAKVNDVPVPPDLEKSVQASKGKVPDWKALYEEEKLRHASTSDELERLKAAGKPLSEKEKNTLYKLLLTMAIKGYAYQHRASRSSTAKEIDDDSKALGISVDEDTVRKWLQKAKDEFGYLLPDDDYKQR